MDQHWKIERWEAEYVYTHIRVAHLLFRSIEFSNWHQVAQVAFQASGVPVVVEVHLFLCTSSKSVDSVLCHCGNEHSRPFDYHETLPGVFLSKTPPRYAPDTEHPASSPVELRRTVSWLVVAFPQSRRAKTLRWPCWPFPRQDACRTVQAVPDPLDLP